MKLYLAAMWEDRTEMEDRASWFEEAGHTITHTWWDIEDLPEIERDPKAMKEQAIDDLNGVLHCDALVLFQSGKSEGKAVEQGIALAMEIPIVAIGDAPPNESHNVFHYLPDFHWVDSIEDALNVLDEL